ncbi:hypothetical protein CcaverHIS002_0608880 [Cutaneotrichosporon cavernicola]|uniref:arginyltransferase n=1 Tax=Cutaneotrichosporon cavernicola TaxID=279322 RepID=A0AA48L9G6_9TREE|nr:uncharacterized protein CcaverHIS019_0608340 [Cutaneotrichosporon cavernicola]BEI86601.1 hypothetical protein CcaverHIS002_0608880 [Cutaneotrichosporon cavernicola]BEI94375.1 hypothetical protein CcaverHIS019_0608340 [Cutaneotrichosporon cavernicola]BEJ02152.1 hypothetical protein CcaverHIS631_0608340 [Cutaneotrichosporon cavernicola]BEJ09913.1 hypothetical protein CcaverHIS641_0608280 [Cutaneotrichosporon cavernicola]
MSLTLLQPIGYDAHSCGYCSPPGARSGNSSRSFGFITEQMSPQFYQGLIERGWRRSGEYTYHPDMARTCCPQYTIRLRVDEFKVSRQQRSSLNRWNRYISGEEPKNGKGKVKPFELGLELRRCRDVSGMAHRFSIELVPAIATDETYNLYERYQIAIHKDQPGKVSRRGFERFLCDSPLGNTPVHYTDGVDATGLPHEYGSYHLLYRVDGHLVGISVIDILPSCVSSVYFIWDPDWAWASLGKLSALYEIGIALDMAAAGAEGMEWLYMGYWIATCQKMRYKGEYSPSFLLDPGTQEFHHLTPKLDQFLQVHSGYTPFKEVEAINDASVREEWEAQRKEDVNMAEPHEPRPKRADKLVMNGNDKPDGPDDSDSGSDSEESSEPNDYPSPPPPGFGDPNQFDFDELDSLFVFFNHSGKPAVLPYAEFRNNLTPIGRRMTKELVAALGPDMFASSPMELRTKALLHFG